MPVGLARSPAGTRTEQRLGWHSVIAGAILVTLARPTTWLVALAGLLAGGGVVLLAWPILTLPTPAGIQNLLGAPVSTLVFGGPTAALLGLVALAALAAVAVSSAGLLTGAWAERQGIALVIDGAADDGRIARSPRPGNEGLAAPPPHPGRPEGPGLAAPPPRQPEGAAIVAVAVPPPRQPEDAAIVAVAVVRLLGLLPSLVVGVLALPTVYAVTYRQLILPDDLAMPLPLRVASEIPGLLALLALVWLLADAAAAVGVRRLVLEGRGPLAAWALGWVDLVRRPHRIVSAALLGDLALVVLAGPVLLVSTVLWEWNRGVLGALTDPAVGVVAVVLWVAVWLAAVVLAGLGAAVRAALLTLEGAPRS